MNTKQLGSRAALLAVAVAVAGLWTSTVRADIIAEDAFNYIPLNASLDGANGGSGWATPHSAVDPATVAPGLTYAPYNIGIGNTSQSALLGSFDAGNGGLFRDIANHTMPTDYWIRALYNPGANDAVGGTTVTPFGFLGWNSGSFSLGRVESASGPFSMELGMTAVANGGEVDPAVDFTLAAGIHMLLWHLHIDTTSQGPEELTMWLDPSGGIGGAGPTAWGQTFFMEGDILNGNSDSLATFTSNGVGDSINQLVIGTTFADAIGQLNDPVTSVPEVSGPVMMAMVGLLGGGVVWYRRRQKAVA